MPHETSVRFVGLDMYDFALIPFTHMYFATPITCYIFHDNHNGLPHGCYSDKLYNVRMIVFNQDSTFFQQRLCLFLGECFSTRFNCDSNMHRFINSSFNHSKVALCDRRIIENKIKGKQRQMPKTPSHCTGACAHIRAPSNK